MTRPPAPVHGEMVVTPPPLHPGQMEVLADPARNKMLRAGRRWRKSGYGVVQAFTGYAGLDGREYLGALTGGQIGWWVPSLTARYLVADWEPIKGLARQVPGHRIEEANHRVIMPSGGSIMMLTGDTTDSGRGLGLDGAVIDEASLMLEVLWSETIQATLLDKIGWSLFLFTPKGQNWIYDLELEVPNRESWSAHHYRTQDNPHIDAAALAELTEGMSSLVYRQEILAEYVTGGAGLFKREWIKHWFAARDDADRVVGYRLGEETVAADACWRFCTVDLAWSLEERADYTVVSTWAVTPKRHLVLLDVARGHIEGPDITRTLQGVYGLWEPSYFVLERAPRQLSIIQEAQRSGLPIREVRADRPPTTGVREDAKVARALTATARMESGQVWLPQADRVPAVTEFIAELLAFPMAAHDDCVDTLSYACLELARGGPVTVGPSLYD